MTRPTYTVTAERTPDGWWYVEAPDVDGAMTQARRLDQLEHMARDVIALLLDVPTDSFDIDVRVELPVELEEVIRRAADARTRAEQADRDAREEQRRAVRELAKRGLPQRDVGRLLGVTHQRVAQVAKAG